MKRMGIDDLNNHMFETIEMLKNNNDPRASKNEKVDIETAKAIVSAGKVIVDGFKVKANVLGMLKNTGNPTMMKQTSIEAGIFSGDDVKLVDNPKSIGE